MNHSAAESVDRLQKAEQLDLLRKDMLEASPEEVALLGACLRMIHAHRYYGCDAVDICGCRLRRYYGLSNQGESEIDVSCFDRVGRLIGARGYRVIIWDHHSCWFSVNWKPSKLTTLTGIRVVSNLGSVEPMTPVCTDEFDEEFN